MNYFGESIASSTRDSDSLFIVVVVSLYRQSIFEVISWPITMSIVWLKNSNSFAQSPYSLLTTCPACMCFQRSKINETEGAKRTCNWNIYMFLIDHDSLYMIHLCQMELSPSIPVIASVSNELQKLWLNPWWLSLAIVCPGEFVRFDNGCKVRQKISFVYLSNFKVLLCKRTEKSLANVADSTTCAYKMQSFFTQRLDFEGCCDLIYSLTVSYRQHVRVIRGVWWEKADRIGVEIAQDMLK